MNLAKINEITNHRITEGSEFGWDCFPDARMLDYESDYAHISVIYSTKNQEVYEANVSVKETAWETDQKPYRYINPEYLKVYRKEFKKRNVDFEKAWDDVDFIDLETEDDFLHKAENIFNGHSDFDKRIQVPVDLEDDVLLKLCMEAHKRDITLNQMVEQVLRNMIEEHKNLVE